MAKKLPAKRTFRGLRELEGKAIVTFNSVRPDELEIKMGTETGIFSFKLDRSQGDTLRYDLGRALDPANEPARQRWS